MLKQSLTLCFCLILSISSFAQTGSSFTQAEANEMVNRHNDYRKEVGVQDLKWSNKIAAYAQEWANHLAANGCNLKHRSTHKYGENIFWGYGKKYTSTQIADEWGQEKKDWKGGKVTMQNFAKAGHYTQMIWFETTEIGCAQATCSNGSLIVVCNYNPSGNVIGEKPEGN